MPRIQGPGPSAAVRADSRAAAMAFGDRNCRGPQARSQRSPERHQGSCADADSSVKGPLPWSPVSMTA